MRVVPIVVRSGVEQGCQSGLKWLVARLLQPEVGCSDGCLGSHNPLVTRSTPATSLRRSARCK